MTGLPEIQLSAFNWTAMHWLPRDDDEILDLNAPYQRGSVWTLDQRRALIKSLYMGLPTGSIITSVLPYREGEAHVRIVDGKQRIETIRSFVADEFTIPFSWLRADDRDGMHFPEGFMVLYSQCSLRFQRTLDNWKMPGLEFQAEREWMGYKGEGKDRHSVWRIRSWEEILQAEAEVYLLINGGGTAQTDEDMARAIAVAGGST